MPRHCRNRTCKQPWIGSSGSSPAAGASCSSPGSCIVVVSVPFAGRQTENLTGGGFETKGSGSKVVGDALTRDFPGMQSEDLAIVFDNRTHDPAALAAAFERVEREGFDGRRGRAAEPARRWPPRAPPASAT